MIVQERIEGTDLVRTYSNMGLLIHGGYPEADYEEAVDPVSAGRTYVETNKYPESDITDAEALAIITGEEVGE
jgi:hypothetical protein